MNLAFTTFAVFLAGLSGASAKSCAQAEDAFFAQYKSQSFAQDRAALLANPDRWEMAAKRYFSGATLIMSAEQAGRDVSKKSADEFLVNAAIVDCWRGSVGSASDRTRTFARYFDAQLPPHRRDMLEAKAQRHQ